MLLSILALSAMNLELLMGTGATIPHLKPLSGLANLFAHVSPRVCLPRDRILWVRWPMSMGVRLASVLPNGPESVLQAGVTP